MIKLSKVVRSTRGEICLPVKDGLYLVEELDDDSILIRPLEVAPHSSLRKEVSIKEIDELIAHGARS